MRSSKLNLSSLPIDELWALHEEVVAALSKRITAEKRELEERLARLNRSPVSDNSTIRPAASQIALSDKVRRKYPPVLPKFQNPADPAQTWAGRGKQPRWLVAQLKAGKKASDFLISYDKRNRAGKRRRA